MNTDNHGWMLAGLIGDIRGINKNVLKRVAIVALGMAVSGCSVLSFFTGDSSTRLKSVQVIAEAEANQNTATALDLVFVYDKSVIETLPKTGPAWFQAKSGLRSAFPLVLDVVAVEIPPAHVVQEVTFPKRGSDAIRVYAYANYIPKAGQFPINLTELKRAVIRLKPDAIQVTAE